MIGKYPISRKIINKKFKYYYKNGEIITDKKEIDRINKLRIPPGYHDIKIFSSNSKEQYTAYDDKGRITKDWEGEIRGIRLGIQFFAHPEGGIGTRMVSLEQRPLGVKQADIVERILRNGYFESERQIGLKDKWTSELRGGWYLVIIPLVILAILVMLGKIFDIL